MPRKTPRRLKVQRVVQKASRRVGRMKVSARATASLPAGPVSGPRVCPWVCLSFQTPVPLTLHSPLLGDSCGQIHTGLGSLSQALPLIPCPQPACQKRVFTLLLRE